jgi:hypothetical protein
MEWRAAEAAVACPILHVLALKAIRDKDRKAGADLQEPASGKARFFELSTADCRNRFVSTAFGTPLIKA